MAAGANPLVSVTVTNYNYAHYLSENLSSILAQTFEDFELIVIDNASTDESVTVIDEFERSDSRVRVIKHDVNEPAIVRFRESCAVSRGRYRVQVDADDWVDAPDALERQVSMLESDPAMTMCYSSMTTYGDDGNKFVHQFHDGDRVLSGAEAIEPILGLSLGHSGMMIRLDAYHRCGGYPEGWRFYDDVLLAARLAELGDVGYIDDSLFAGRQHPSNESRLITIEVMEREVLAMIDEILSGPLRQQIPDADGMRRRLRRKALTHHAMLAVFNNRPREGFALYTQSLKRYPMETFFQKTTISMAARALLGAEYYERARRAAHRPFSMVRGRGVRM